MSDTRSTWGQRVLVIGLSSVKNEEVVTSLRDLCVDAIGCTKPDTAAEQFDARQFEVIAFGRATLGPMADGLKRMFSNQDPSVEFVDAFGPIAVQQVTAALRRRPKTPLLVDYLAFTPYDRGGQITATAQTSCHIAISLYCQSSPGTLEQTRLVDAEFAEGPMSLPVHEACLSGAYSLVAIADGEELHHVPFL